MKRILIATILALTLSVFEYGWRVELPPLPNFAPRVAPVQAASGGDDPTLCDPWKMAGGVLIYRCPDDETGVVCFANGLGMLSCVLP